MPLGDYAEETFTHHGKTRRVFRRGEGPAVLVIAEVPGITPRVVEFADRVVDIGCTAVLPSLFGDPGERPTIASTVRRAVWGTCVSREFATLVTRRTSPVTVWLRALGRHEHGRCGGPGIGAVGMCFTGGFALAMMVDDVMLAPVLSQPSLPYPVSKRHKRDLGISDDDLAKIKKRAADGVEVLGLRFTGDRLCPAARFDRLQDELGDKFIRVDIDSAAGNSHGVPKGAHSVLTEHFVDEPGNPTRDALAKVVDLFRRQLLTDTSLR